jgi:hypothetical protein
MFVRLPSGELKSLCNYATQGGRLDEELKGCERRLSFNADFTT